MPQPTREVATISAPARGDLSLAHVRRARPVVLRGLADGWPARARWSPRYFREAFGDHPVSIARTDAGVLVQDRARGLVEDASTFAAFIEALEGPAPSGYLIAPLAELPEALRADVRTPPYCAAAPWLRSKLWLSAPGTVSPLHRDASHNLLAQVQGVKQVLLFSPRDNAALYSHAIWSSLPNFSRVDPEAPDLARFPRFARAEGLRCRLHPGDALLIPSGWWHHVRTLETSISVNFWWATGLLLPLVLAADAYKRARRLSR